MLPKRMFVCDEVATQRVAADTFMDDEPAPTQRIPFMHDAEEGAPFSPMGYVLHTR
jgi:hypothetical protein